MTALAFAPNGVQKSTLSNMIEEWFTNDFIRQGNIQYPKTNIKELDDVYIIEMSVPGLSKNSLDIKVERNQLSISTVKSEQETIENDSFKMKEFSSLSFSKQFHLSDDINTEAISAKCENGILSITLPKKDEAKTLPPRSINID